MMRNPAAEAWRNHCNKVAAAEVGECETWDAAAIRALTNRIIERCAQVAEQHCCEECGTQIAAAIRALKDKP